jgi:hypothetical protein
VKSYVGIESLVKKYPEMTELLRKNLLDRKFYMVFFSGMLKFYIFA